MQEGPGLEVSFDENPGFGIRGKREGDGGFFGFGSLQTLSSKTEKERNESVIHGSTGEGPQNGGQAQQTGVALPQRIIGSVKTPERAGKRGA